MSLFSAHAVVNRVRVTSFDACWRSSLCPRPWHAVESIYCFNNKIKGKSDYRFHRNELTPLEIFRNRFCCLFCWITLHRLEWQLLESAGGLRFGFTTTADSLLLMYDWAQRICLQLIVISIYGSLWKKNEKDGFLK